MKSNREIDIGYSRLRWVVLLLIIAVVLPTVCLLWFMTQAVKNERLAVRQKLIDVYSEKVSLHLTSPLKDSCEMEFGSLRWSNLKKAFWNLNQPIKSPAIIVYDEQGQLLWTLTEDEQSDFIESELYTKAQSLEYADHNYPMALQFYKELIDSNDTGISGKIKMSMARCYLKMDDVKSAKSIYQEISYSIPTGSDDYEYAFVCDPDVMRARVALAELYAKAGDPNLEQHLEKCLQGIVYLEDIKQYRTLLFTPDVWIWGLNRLIGLAEKNNLDLRLETGHAKKRIKEQKYCSLVLYIYDYEKVRELESGIVTSLGTEPALYGIKGQVEGWQIFLIADTDTIVKGHLRGHWDKINNESCFVRLIDDKDRCIAGPNRPNYEPLITVAVGELFPKWKAQVYLKDNDIFESAVRRQASIYIWTGTLVVVLILAAGGFATQAVGKQIRLNRLKNDFIATVSHELKTPLSSMRVLVDTLLEGNYEGQKTAIDYLHLISKENERLSRLIDNFLTFSRMERNKKAFDIGRVSPAEIAQTAAEAVQTKLIKGKCRLDVSIEEGLPDVSADRDAMVTVLVNLLDNAYKYSYDNKQIELRVFGEGSFICFSVKDNGIGMTRRQIKKVFDRFYQADSSLSRQAEGTGLGLAIVKFIADAHKGQITVESKPGTGSTFTIKLEET